MAKKQQLEIAGAERPVIAEIDDLVPGYTEALYAAKEQTERANAIRPQILEQMRKHGLQHYESQDGEYLYQFDLKETDIKLTTKRKHIEGDL